MVDNSKLFEKYKLNNNVEVPGLLAVAPLTLFGSNPDGSVSDEEREYLKLRATNIDYIFSVQLLLVKKE